MSHLYEIILVLFFEFLDDSVFVIVLWLGSVLLKRIGRGLGVQKYLLYRTWFLRDFFDS